MLKAEIAGLVHPVEIGGGGGARLDICTVSLLQGVCTVLNLCSKSYIEASGIIIEINN